jgi:hypothetical protein
MGGRPQPISIRGANGRGGRVRAALKNDDPRTPAPPGPPPTAAGALARVAAANCTGSSSGLPAAECAAWHRAAINSSGVPGVPQDPLAPRRGPLGRFGSSPDRERAIGNAPALVPEPSARL